MSGDEWTVNSDHTLECYIEHVKKTYDEHKYFRSKITTGKQRTNLQNAALHKYFSMLADSLNDAGWDMKKTLKPEIDIPWNCETIKEYLWRPIQKAVIGKTSTTKADRTEYTKVYETLNRYTSSKLGVSIPWPSKDEQ